MSVSGPVAGLARPAYPLLLWPTAASLVAVALGAFAVRSYVLGGYLLALALFPFRPSKTQAFWNFFLCLGMTGWVLLGLFPVLAHEQLEGPYGGPPWLFVLAQLVVLPRAWVLSREHVERYVDERWRTELFVPADELPITLSNALRSAPSERAERVDAAVAALSVAAMPDEETARRALLVNAYNVFAAHANRGRRSLAWYDLLEVYRTRYCLAGTYFSLDELEHGLLRNNAPHPAFGRMFRSGDPRLRWRVSLDPRIHFALHCGARSCPPVRVFEAEKLDAQLSLARDSFLTSETTLELETRTLETSKILSWYAVDFGGPTGTVALLLEALGRPDLTKQAFALRFRPYDWTNPDE